LCVLFLQRGARLVCLESAVVVAARTVCRIPKPEVLAISPQTSDSEVETFVANLGRHRSTPTLRRVG
jgi:hypothetical protein